MLFIETNGFIDLAFDWQEIPQVGKQVVLQR
jgi:hypothetical protein